MYDHQWTKRAVKDLAKIQPEKQRQKIFDAVSNLSECPTANANVKALKNHDIGFRLRVGDYRVLFDIDNGIRIITVQEVKKRDERTY